MEFSCLCEQILEIFIFNVVIALFVSITAFYFWKMLINNYLFQICSYIHGNSVLGRFVLISGA